MLDLYQFVDESLCWDLSIRNKNALFLALIFEINLQAIQKNNKFQVNNDGGNFW
jgi:hypothetical protein